MAGCSIREEGLRAAALPGGVAAADAVALDAGPRAHERVGHIYQHVLGVTLREQVFLRWASGSLIDDVGENKSSAL